MPGLISSQQMANKTVPAEIAGAFNPAKYWLIVQTPYGN
jgi:hypothetical protein